MELRFYCLALVFLTVVTTGTGALDCYTCANASHVSECKSTTTCNAGEKCSSIIQDGNNAGSGSIVGRSVSMRSCAECCRNQHCNRQLCQHSFSEKECSDSTEINCKSAGTVVNICTDTQHAKTVCERFCGLCGYADGSWSSWLTWSSCDVTCGNGTKTRIRKCTEPLPTGGGHDCTGQSQEVQPCTEDTCLDGGWSSWQAWGTCSRTCGDGIRSRSRLCDSPLPSIQGKYCQGDSFQVEICIMQSCPITNGVWGAWLAWTSCSASCNGGLQSRQRHCNNPKPSADGDFCEGSSFDVRMCNQHYCPVTNGGWGSWTSWTSCTASCNGGMQSRLRHCNNPTPSADGGFCLGSSFDTQLCNKEHCPRQKAAFLAESASKLSNGIVRFSSLQLNEGSVYDNSTGEFTCPLPGLYVFIANMIESGAGFNLILCYIIKNHHRSVYVFSLQGSVDGKYVTNGYGTATGAATLHLVKGDSIAVYCSRNTGTNITQSSFSGFLVSADP